jgi:N-methylhydantoinase B
LFSGGKKLMLPGKVTFRASLGDRLRIETPGGGGWGKSKNARRGDAET